MNVRFKNLTVRSIYLFIDFVCITASIYIACIIRHNTMAFEITLSTIFFGDNNPYRFLFLFWLITTIVSLNSRALYQTRREILEGFEIGLIIRSVIWAGFLMIIASYALRIQDFPRSVFLIGSTLMMVLLSIWRIIKRVYVGYLVSRGYNNFNAMIIGAGRVGTALREQIKKIPALGINVVGYLDDFKTNDDTPRGVKVLGKISDFRRLAKKEFINKIFITIHHDSKAFIKLLEEAKELGVAVRVVPQGFELMSGEFSKYNIGIIPILEYCDSIPLRIQMGKRVFDFFTSFVSLMLVLPFFIIIAIWIKLDSKGPIFYISRRYGRNGQVFNMYKFRSMCFNADQEIENLRDQNEVDGPIFKIKKDPRVTRVGKFLRKYSLDELPQIINVLKGQMSFVGPRPLPIDQVEREDLNQLMRLEVRPGITGLWQIKGRSDISFEQMIKWDVWYINNWSFWLDLHILYRTLPVVIEGKGAY